MNIKNYTGYYLKITTKQHLVPEMFTDMFILNSPNKHCQVKAHRITFVLKVFPL